MKIRIQGGTARHDEPPLCTTCRHSKIASGVRANEEIVECRELETRVTFKVTTCSRT